MTENHDLTRDRNKPPGARCPVGSEQILLEIYGETVEDGSRSIQSHLAECDACREQMRSFRETLAVIDMAEIPAMASALAERDAPEIRFDLARRPDARTSLFADSPGATRRRAIPLWLQAAAVLLIAGASFLAGAGWMSPPDRTGTTASIAMRQGDSDEGRPRDPGTTLREFTARTDGYLNRTRIVLLEIANADTDPDSSIMREAVRSLLAETRDARQIAEQIPDPRIDDLLGRLESVLLKISALPDWENAATVERIRDQVNESGLLEQIEILTPPPTHLAHRRSGR